MSFRLKEMLPPLPTRGGSGYIEILFGTRWVKLDAPFVRSDFPVSNFLYAPSNILLYMRNDSEIIVMRYDDTYSIYTAKDRKLIEEGVYDMSYVLDIVEIVPTGQAGLDFSPVVEYSAESEGAPINWIQAYSVRVKDDNHYVYLDPNDHMAYVYTMEDNPWFYEAWKKNPTASPEIYHIYKDELDENGNPKSVHTEHTTGREFICTPLMRPTKIGI